ncbi:MAG: hypothetical protein ACI8WB_003515 [Phenylobacterium sp.]|jgi:hypothetical protein
MKTFNRSPNTVSSSSMATAPTATKQQQTQTEIKKTSYGWKNRLADKFMDYYLPVMAGVLCLIGLSPFTLMLMQY